MDLPIITRMETGNEKGLEILAWISDDYFELFSPHGN